MYFRSLNLSPNTMIVIILQLLVNSIAPFQSILSIRMFPRSSKFLGSRKLSIVEYATFISKIHRLCMQKCICTLNTWLAAWKAFLLVAMQTFWQVQRSVHMGCTLKFDCGWDWPSSKVRLTWSLLMYQLRSLLYKCLTVANILYPCLSVANIFYLCLPIANMVTFSASMTTMSLFPLLEIQVVDEFGMLYWPGELLSQQVSKNCPC